MDFQITSKQKNRDEKRQQIKSYLYAVAAQNRPDPQWYGENGSML